MFWQACHFYNWDPERLLKMPVRLFWDATRHVDRLRAASDMRQLNVALVAASTANGGDMKAFNELHSALMETMGTVMKFKDKISTKEEILALQRETIR